MILGDENEAKKLHERYERAREESKQLVLKNKELTDKFNEKLGIQN